jgi:hypothetical protein
VYRELLQETENEQDVSNIAGEAAATACSFGNYDRAPRESIIVQQHGSK